MLLAGSVDTFAQDVRCNFDKQANVAGFKTYKWVPIKGAQAPNDLVDSQIKAAIDTNEDGRRTLDHRTDQAPRARTKHQARRTKYQPAWC